MKCKYSCGSSEHLVTRRSLLGGMLASSAGVMGLGNMVQRSVAEQLNSQQKRVLVFFLSGGVSQLETWDPKPGTDTGGPFRAIETSVPGTHISELLPFTARQMHRLSIVRSVNTRENDHGKGAVFMETGRPQMPGVTYPVLGSAAAKLLNPENSKLPGYIHICGGSGFDKGDAAFLGAKYGSVRVNDKPPENLARGGNLSEEADQRRNNLRKLASDRFSSRRRTAETEAYLSSYDQAQEMMRRMELFDVTKESAQDQDRYGKHDFGKHCLLARRLLENDFTCVRVTHTNYDTHYENFDFHIEQLGEFDRPFANLIQDLDERGMLASTLVVVMSEFGRTPQINSGLGRDHWGTAWSVAMSGCGLQRGAVVGKTNENGTQVVDREVDGRHLYHTYMKALGIDPAENFLVEGRPIPIADPSGSSINELLA